MPDGTPNALRHEVSDHAVEILYDLLVHVQGPRIRDHLSHGELSCCAFTRELASHILSVGVGFCLRYIGPEYIPQVPNLLTTLIQEFNTYTSIFHPISLLKHEILEAADSLEQWTNLPAPNHGESCLDAWKEDTKMQLTLGSYRRILLHLASVLLGETEVASEVVKPSGKITASIGVVLQKPVCTLYRSRPDMEIVTLLRNICTQALTVSCQVSHLELSAHTVFFISRTIHTVFFIRTRLFG